MSNFISGWSIRSARLHCSTLFMLQAVYPGKLDSGIPAVVPKLLWRKLILATSGNHPQWRAGGTHLCMQVSNCNPRRRICDEISQKKIIIIIIKISAGKSKTRICA